MENLKVSEENTKKKYQTPELKSFGKVGEVTQTKGVGAINDGGGAANYAS